MAGAGASATLANQTYPQSAEFVAELRAAAERDSFKSDMFGWYSGRVAVLLDACDRLIEVAENDGILLDDDDEVASALKDFIATVKRAKPQ
jgi:hypothetical protein